MGSIITSEYIHSSCTVSVTVQLWPSYSIQSAHLNLFSHQYHFVFLPRFVTENQHTNNLGCLCVWSCNVWPCNVWCGQGITGAANHSVAVACCESLVVTHVEYSCSLINQQKTGKMNCVFTCLEFLCSFVLAHMLMCSCLPGRTCYMAGSRWRPWPTSGTKKFARGPPALRMRRMKQNFCELNKQFQFTWKQWKDIVCPGLRVCVCVSKQALFSVSVTCASHLFTCLQLNVTEEPQSGPTVHI